MRTTTTGYKPENTTYQATKPKQCEAPVALCVDCPYDTCLFDSGNKRMNKRKERGVYKKHA